jgi:hypothetical protein
MRNAADGRWLRRALVLLACCAGCAAQSQVSEPAQAENATTHAESERDALAILCLAPTHAPLAHVHEGGAARFTELSTWVEHAIKNPEALSFYRQLMDKAPTERPAALEARRRLLGLASCDLARELVGDLKARATRSESERAVSDSLAMAEATSRSFMRCPLPSEEPDGLNDEQRAWVAKRRGQRTARSPSKAPPGMGRLAKGAIRAVALAHKGEVSMCFTLGHGRDARTRGRLAIELVIAADGHVASTRIAANETGSEGAACCIANQARTWVFPAPEGAVLVNFPYVFTPHDVRGTLLDPARDLASEEPHDVSVIDADSP